MSVLVYAESWKGSFRKSTFEAISYANETAKLLNTNLIAFSIGEVSDEVLKEVGNYGAEKIISFDNINKGDSQAAANAIGNIADETTVLIFSNTYTAKMIAPRLSAKLEAGIISNVITLSESSSPLRIKRKAFSSAPCWACCFQVFPRFMDTNRVTLEVLPLLSTEYGRVMWRLAVVYSLGICAKPFRVVSNITNRPKIRR